jgi:hypothetical protein
VSGAVLSGLTPSRFSVAGRSVLHIHCTSRVRAAPSASSAAPRSTPWPRSAGLPASGTGKARVMRRQQLTEAQITALFDPPTDQRELVRHYTLSAADLAAIRRCRGYHNRLGHALMLCYLGAIRAVR